MMRDRAWRRFKQEIIQKRRIRYTFSRQCWYRGLPNSNGDIISNPIWVDILGHKSTNFFKCDKTEIWISKNKCKYSPNKNRSYYRDLKKQKFDSLGCREKDKIIFKFILKEYGIK